jgi:tRNA(Ile)-lysidine synthase
MLVPGQKVGVAVSGGADSVCLLVALRELAPALQIALHVLHLDHGLRGDESCADAEFVRELASRFELPLVRDRIDLRQHRGNLEQAAREARLAFFRRHLEAGTVNRVAVGHTRSDQAETVLFRFLRGAGTAGLAGIRPVTADGIVRPLIEVDRQDVEDFLKRRRVFWREDSTNRSLEFARNRIRHNLLPQLEREWNPALADTLARTADWALAEEAWWEAEIRRLGDRLLTHSEGAILLRAKDLSSLPAAPARRLIRLAMELAKGGLRGINFGHIEAVEAMAAAPGGHGRVMAPGIEIVRSLEWLRFAKVRREDAPVPRRYNLQARVPSLVEIPDTGLAVSLELLERPETTDSPEDVYNMGVGCIDWPSVSGPLELRNWRPGDRYQPIGYTGAEKIKDLFQEARIPLWERSGWPVLTDRCGIVWVRRFGPAAGLAPGRGARPVLRVREIVKIESETPSKASIKIE